MMFLQFFTWGAWFVTLAPALLAANLGDIIAPAYGSAPIAAIVAPLLLGVVADRFFPSQFVMAALFLLGGGLMWFAPGLAESGSGAALAWIFTGHMLCFMPTLGLANTVAFANLASADSFPKVRVFGTLGWIAAGLTVGVMGWSDSINIFRLAAIVSLATGVYCLTLPHTPAPAKGEPLRWRTLLMLDAFALLRSRAFAVFILCSALICVPLAYYFASAATYIGHAGFVEPASTLTLGQVSELGFMLLIPLLFRRLGVKWMIGIGMAAWVVRYLLFAFGAPDQVAWMLIAGIVLHGICYDFFFVVGFMYADRRAPKNVRGQVQALLVFATQGVGMYVGYWIAGLLLTKTVTRGGDLTEAIAAGGEAQTLTFGERLARLFRFEAWPSLDASLLQTAMDQWRQYWLVPAGMAAVVLVVFLLLFRDDSRPASDEPPATAT